MLLSICLTVYNQMELVRNNIQEIIKYKGDNIEIVVSDDNSTDSMEEMVKSFRDNRIKYYKTKINKSHDGNIINGLRNCRGDFVFLFRSKDVVIPDALDEVMNIIKVHKKASYFLFSALDECGNNRMALPDQVYIAGGQAQKAHNNLLIHPSGQIYRRDFLRLDLYEKYIDEYFPSFNGCDVHQLIRMDLALQGDFVTSSCYAWRYAYTLKSDKKSVIKTVPGIGIYAPYYQYQRFRCEFEFADRETPEPNRKEYLLGIIGHYSDSIIPGFVVINRDEAYHSHYNSQPVKFSAYKEIPIFREKALYLIRHAGFSDKKELESFLDKKLWHIFFLDTPKAYMIVFFSHHPVFRKMVRPVYRKAKALFGKSDFS